MSVTGYKARLKKDISYKGLWSVSFTLKEMWENDIMGASNQKFMENGLL